MFHCHFRDRTMSDASSVSSMSRDVLEDWLAVLFQENKTQLQTESSLTAKVDFCAVTNSVQSISVFIITV